MGVSIMNRKFNNVKLQNAFISAFNSANNNYEFNQKSQSIVKETYFEINEQSKYNSDLNLPYIKGEIIIFLTYLSSLLYNRLKNDSLMNIIIREHINTLKNIFINELIFSEDVSNKVIFSRINIIKKLLTLL